MACILFNQFLNFVYLFIRKYEFVLLFKVLKLKRDRLLRQNKFFDETSTGHLTLGIKTVWTKYSRVLILSWEKEYLQANRLQTDCSFNF